MPWGGFLEYGAVGGMGIGTDDYCSVGAKAAAVIELITLPEGAGGANWWVQHLGYSRNVDDACQDVSDYSAEGGNSTPAWLQHAFDVKFRGKAGNGFSKAQQRCSATQQPLSSVRQKVALFTLLCFLDPLLKLAWIGL